MIQTQDKIAAAESENNLEVTKHKEVLEKFQGAVVQRYRLEKAKVEYNRLKEDIDRSRLIVATLKQQIKKPPHNITEVSLAYLQRDLKKYQYHTNLLERRRTRRYKICRKERPPIEVESDTEYSDGGYSTAEDLKDKECLPHSVINFRALLPHIYGDINKLFQCFVELVFFYFLFAHNIYSKLQHCFSIFKPL